MKTIKLIISILTAIVAALILLRIGIFALGIVFTLVKFVIGFVIMALITVPIYFFVRNKFLK